MEDTFIEMLIAGFIVFGFISFIQASHIKKLNKELVQNKFDFDKYRHAQSSTPSEEQK